MSFEKTAPPKVVPNGGGVGGGGGGDDGIIPPRYLDSPLGHKSPKVRINTFN